jgi:hypothetical protein
VSNFLGLENSQELKKSLMDKPIEARPKATFSPVQSQNHFKP